MKSVLAAAGILLCFSFWGVPVLAAPASAQITFAILDLPDDMQGRSFMATVSAGPSDPLAVQTILSDLNGYTETVSVEPGTYYCNAATQYDPAGDYPVTEVDNIYEVTLAEGESITLTYAVGDTGYYESITGEHRYADEIEIFTPPDGYDPDASAQIGTYLTAPDGFDHHVIVYLGNQYTGEAYTLDVYASNDLAATKTDASAGKYQFLGARVADDDARRYSIQAEQATLDTADGAIFHLTITDTENPDRKLTTPSLDNNSAVQQANTYNSDSTISEPTPQPTAAPDTNTVQERPGLFISMLPELIILGILLLASVAIYFIRKSKEG